MSWKGGRFVVTDGAVDPDGRIGSALTEKLALKDRQILERRRGRPADVIFDAAVVAACHKHGVKFGLNKATIRLAEQIGAQHGIKDHDAILQRVKRMVMASKNY